MLSQVRKPSHKLVFPLNLTSPIAWVYSSDTKASEDLHAFAKLNENRLYKLLKTCFNPQADLKSIAKSSVGLPPPSLPN